MYIYTNAFGFAIQRIHDRFAAGLRTSRAWYCRSWGRLHLRRAPVPFGGPAAAVISDIAVYGCWLLESYIFTQPAMEATCGIKQK